MFAGVILAAGIVALALPRPQDLAPGVLLVSRIKEHTRQQLTRMLDYTCLETIQRYRKPAGRGWDGKLNDTVRLEVLFTGTKEMYSAPGERHFTEDHPAAFSSMGFSQDGLFGIYLYNVLVGGLAQYTYRGEEDLAGRRAAKYDFRVSSLAHPMTLSLGEKGQTTAGMKGTFWADPASLDVLRLDIHADDISPTFAVTSTSTVMHYAPVRIGDLDIMLAQSAEARIEMASGEAARNVVELTHCRSFAAQSSVSYGPPEGEKGETQPAFSLPGAEFAMMSQAVPAGLRVTVALSQPVTGTTAIGSLIEGTVAGAVAAKGSKVAIPDGAVVRGRVRRVERQPESGALLLALEFTDVEVDNTRLRFYADLESADRLTGVEWKVTADAPPRAGRAMGNDSAAAARAETPGLPNLPGVAYFLARGETLELPKGFSMVWKTQSLAQ